MCSANERIEQLKTETRYMRKEIKDLKDTLMQQNEMIISLLSKQASTLDETVETASTSPHIGTDRLDQTNDTERTLPKVVKGNKVSQFSRRFPLKNIGDLDEFELEINEDNKGHIVNIVHKLLSNCLSKNIVNVLSDNIIIESNIDGYHYKTRLLNYPKIMDVLFLACRKDNDCTSKMFLDDLKRSLRVVKNRHHKNTFRARKKLLSDDHGQEELSEQIVRKTFTVKTEEIYFPPCSL